MPTEHGDGMLVSTEHGDGMPVSTEHGDRMPLSTEEAEKLLGTLIRLLNPYAQTMHYPRGNLPANEEAVHKEAALRSTPSNELSQFQLEVDNRYGSQNGGEYLFWDFKGQAQTVKKAARIQYRHPVIKDNTILYWITDHLLVGYAGSNGP
jgi:hypothetical protein